jgi:protein-S-isoprenylcysteine O-methyltransferase Ste14
VGGGSITTRRTSQVRLAAAAAALGLGTVLAIVSALGSSDRAGWLWGFGVVGVLATLVALAGWAGATWWGVVALGAE